MKEFLTRSWWMLALQGVIAIIFGVLALLWPGLTLLWLVALFAAYALLTGGIAVWAAIKNRAADSKWWLVLLLGLVSIAAGVMAIFNPAITALVLVLLMGANALVTGILQIIIAIRLRKTVSNEWLLVLSGIVGMVFGALVLIFPGAGALALVWLVSFWAVFSGVLLLVLAFRARRWEHEHTPGAGTRPGRPQPQT
jgi:uncharacterized membrane protein HdeD (DUF308 family)